MKGTTSIMKRSIVIIAVSLALLCAGAFTLFMTLGRGTSAEDLAASTKVVDGNVMGEDPYSSHSYDIDGAVTDIASYTGEKSGVISFHNIWGFNDSYDHNVYWSISDSGVLTLEARGGFATYSYLTIGGSESYEVKATDYPWHKFRKVIKEFTFKLVGDSKGFVLANDISYMFWGMENLTTINIPTRSSALITYRDVDHIGGAWDKEIKLYRIKEMFNGCKSLTNLDVSWITLAHINTAEGARSDELAYFAANTNKVASVKNFTGIPSTTLTDYSYMFYNLGCGCDTDNLPGELTFLKKFGNNFNWPDASDFKVNMSHMFDGSGFSSIEFIINNNKAVCNLNKVSDMSYMFANMKHLSYTNTGMIAGEDNTVNLSGIIAGSVDDMSYMFAGSCMTNLILFECSPKNCQNMFDGCKNLKTLNISALTDTFCTNRKYMFSGCSSLGEDGLTLSSLSWGDVPTGNLNIEGLFYGCKNLNFKKTLTISTTNAVGSFDNMFYGCESLTSLKIAIPTDVTNTMCMFKDCKKLVVDLSGSDTPNVTNMSGMFWNYGTESITYNSDNNKFDNTLDISSFNTSKVVDMSNMLNGVKSFEVGDAFKITTNNNTTNMLSTPNANDPVDDTTYTGCFTTGKKRYSADDIVTAYKAETTPGAQTFYWETNIQTYTVTISKNGLDVDYSRFGENARSFNVTTGENISNLDLDKNDDAYILRGTYVTDGNGNITKEYGEATTKWAKPGEEVKYWYITDSNTPFDFNTPITEDITLTAKTEIAIYNITYQYKLGDSYVTIDNASIYESYRTWSKGKESLDLGVCDGYELVPGVRVGPGLAKGDIEDGYLYDFDGWYKVTSDGSLSKIPNLVFTSWTDYRDVTIVAVFKPKKYNVKYILDETSEETRTYPDIGSYSSDSAPGAPVDPKKAYHKFKGWRLSVNEGSSFIDIPEGCFVESGSGVNKKHSFKYNINVEFDGTDSLASLYQDQTKIVGNEIYTVITFYADWEEQKKEIVYNLDGGTLPDNYILDSELSNGGNNHEYKCDSTFNLPTPYKAGYEFAGWSLELGGNNKVTKRDTSTGDEDYAWYDGITLRLYDDIALHSKPITLYANWTQTDYTFKFDLDGGTYNDKSTITDKQVKVGQRLSTLNATYSKDNYIFAGWYFKTEGSDLFDENNKFNIDTADQLVDTILINSLYTYEYNSEGNNWTVTPTVHTDTGAIVLYARWNKETFTITYDNSAINDTSLDLTFNGTEVTEFDIDSGAVTLTRYNNVSGTDDNTAYTFGGFYYGNDNSNVVTGFYVDKTQGKIYLYNGAIDTENLATNRTMTLDAVSNLTFNSIWTVATRTVTFDTKGGSLTVDNNTFDTTTEDKTYKLTPNYYDKITDPGVPTYTGRTFAGWYTSDDNGVTLSAEPFHFGTTNITGSITLYAKWTVKTYKITINKKIIDTATDTVTATEEQLTEITGKVYDADVLSELNTALAGLSYPGYTYSLIGFAGWLENGQLKDSATMPDQDVTLTVEWNLTSYKIEYTNYEGTITVAKTSYNVASNKGITQLDTANSPCDTTNGGTAPDIYKPYTNSFTGWRYNGELVDSYQVVNVGNDRKLALYYNSVEITGSPFAFGDITLTADWDYKGYPVTYKTSKNDPYPNIISTGTVGIDPKDTVTRPTNPVKNGFSFAGWYTSNDNGETLDTEFKFDDDIHPTQITGPITLYAKWTINTYTWTFHDGWNNSTTNVSFTIEDLAENGNAFNVANPTLTGYTFVGWYDNYTSATYVVGSSAVDNGDGNKVTALSIAIGDPTTRDLYARFEINQYTVSFSTSGGVPVPASQTLNYYSLATEPTGANVPEKLGYTFAGWYTSDNNGATLSNDPFDFGTTHITEDMVLYVKWDLVTYTWTFHNGWYDKTGSTWNSATKTVEFTIENINTINGLGIDDPAITGYTFSGWYDNHAGVTYVVDSSAVDNGDGTLVDALSLTNNDLYAGFEIKMITITFQISPSETRTITAPYYTDINDNTDPYVSVHPEADFHRTTNNVSNPTRAGYTFAGYNNITSIWADIECDSSNGWYSNNTQELRMPAENKTITSEWIAIEYTITLHDYREKEDEPGVFEDIYAGNDPIGYTAESGYILGGMPNYDDTTFNGWKLAYRPGYTFVGWYDAWDSVDNCVPTTANKIESYPKGSTGLKDIYAKWEKDEYTIVFHLADNSTITRTYSYNATVGSKAPNNKGTRPGHETDSDWWTENGIKIEANYQITGEMVLLYGDNEDKIHLYAHTTLKEFEYTLTVQDYDSDSYVITESTSTSEYSYFVNSGTIILSDRSYTGYSFDGWYLVENGVITNKKVTSIVIAESSGQVQLKNGTTNVGSTFAINNLVDENKLEFVAKFTHLTYTIELYDGVKYDSITAYYGTKVYDAERKQFVRVRIDGNGEEYYADKDGNAIETEPGTIPEDAYIIDPRRAGQKFSNWKDGNDNYSPDITMPNLGASTLALTANYAPNVYIVNFISLYEEAEKTFKSEINPISVVYGTKITRPSILYSDINDHVGKGYVLDASSPEDYKWYVFNGTEYVEYDFNKSLNSANFSTEFAGDDGYGNITINLYIKVRPEYVTVKFESKYSNTIVGNDVPSDIDTLPYRFKLTETAGHTSDEDADGLRTISTPTANNLDFVGWYIDANYQNAFNFDSEIKGNITLYAKWTIKKYTVVFKDGNVTKATINNVEHGSMIDESKVPADPARVGYIFEGWFIGSADGTSIGDNKYETNDTVTENLYFYAKWTKGEYTITYNVNDGEFGNLDEIFGEGKYDIVHEGDDVEEVEEETEAEAGEEEQQEVETRKIIAIVYHYTIDDFAEEDSVITLPTAITKTGYDFKGWTSENRQSANTMADIGRNAIRDYVLYAKWDLHKYDFTFNANGGNYNDDRRDTTFVAKVGYNETASPLAEDKNPKRDGYEFEGWYTSEDNGTTLAEEPFDFENTVITADTTVYAKWTAVESGPLSTSAIIAITIGATVVLGGGIAGISIWLTRFLRKYRG